MWDAVSVSRPETYSRPYGEGASSPPIELPLPKFADKDFIPERLQSMWVATQEYPDALPSLASQSLCLDLDAMSSWDSEACADGAPAVSPVVISDQELTVISVHSSDTDLDSSQEDCLSHSHRDLYKPQYSGDLCHLRYRCLRRGRSLFLR